MEFIGIIVFYFIASFVWRLIVGTGSAAIKSRSNGGSFGDNLSVQFNGIGEFEIRSRVERLGEDHDGPRALIIEAKGLIPVHEPTAVGFVTSVFDATDGDLEPVISFVDQFQEPQSSAYQHRIDGGSACPNEGYISWVRVGIVLLDILQPPKGGVRKIKVLLRIIDRGNPPRITHGFSEPNHPGTIYGKFVETEYSYDGKGYLEEAEHRDEARALTVRLAIAVAMADGSLDDSEGDAIRDWIIRTISVFSDGKRDQLKDLYNSAMKSAYSDAKSGSLSLGEVCDRLNEIGEEPQKLDAIELCFDVMAADGVAEETEMALISKVADVLDVDIKELEAMRDQRLVKLNAGVQHSVSIESILGIDTSWPNEKINKHIRTEYSKWNNRLNTLPEGEERENAQQMLNRVAEARKKYA